MPVTNSSVHFEYLDKMLTILQDMYYTTNTCTDPRKVRLATLVTSNGTTTYNPTTLSNALKQHLV